MARITENRFRQLPLRVHEFLSGIPLEDAWVVRLPRTRAGLTLDAFLCATAGELFPASPIVAALLRFRFRIGASFGWDRQSSRSRETFADRLNSADRQRSLVPAGTAHGPFRIVYRFQNEQLEEIINKTVHAALLTALVEDREAYSLFIGVYVRSVGPLTRLYMAAIAPFRRLIVYPSLLRSARENWIHTTARIG